MPKPPCSDHPGQSGAVIVIEGMPGTGKTTALTLLSGCGHRVIGEYITTGNPHTLAVSAHPAVADDDRHTSDYLNKHQHIDRIRSTGPVLADRDWLSLLAYAIALGPDSPRLARARAHWIRACLTAGQLGVPDNYIITHARPDQSLIRRQNRLTPAHPWSTHSGLARTAAFYRDPLTATAALDPVLAQSMSVARFHHLDDPGPIALAEYIEHLTGTRSCDRQAS